MNVGIVRVGIDGDVDCKGDSADYLAQYSYVTVLKI